MYATLATFAERADVRGGNLSLIGIFDIIRVRELPGRFHNHLVTFKLIGERAGKRKLSFRTVDPSGRSEAESIDVVFEGTSPPVCNIGIVIDRWVFPVPGLYRFELLAQEQSVAVALLKIEVNPHLKPGEVQTASLGPASAGPSRAAQA